MIYVSELMLQHHDLETFEQLCAVIKEVASSGEERFFKIDLKPEYPDTPENWEDRLEAAFT